MGGSRECLPSTNELVDVLASRLERRTCEHEHGTNPDGRPTADTVRKVGSEGVAGQRPNILHILQNTSKGPEMLAIYLNCVQ